MIAIAREADQPVGAGEALVVLEAMKMEHEILAEVAGVVRRVDVAVGETVERGPAARGDGRRGQRRRAAPRANGRPDPDERREDLEAVIERHELGLDEARPDAVAKRHEQNRRTARENLADLVDDGTLRRVRAADLRRPGGAGAPRTS